MSQMWAILSRIGAAVGNWNDRRANHDTRSESTRVYRAVDTVSGRFYMLGDRDR